MNLTSEQKRILLETPLFAGRMELCAEDTEGAELLTFNKGEALLSAGEAGGRLLVLLRGAAEVYKHAAGADVLMSVLRPGALMGAATMFLPGAAAQTTVRAKSAAETLCFSQARLTALMERDFAVARNYIAYLTGRIHFLSGRIESIAGHTAADKLYAYLASQSDENGTVVLSRGMSALASALSISRASLYRVMDELAAGGLIERSGKEIRLIRQEEY